MRMRPGGIVEGHGQRGQDDQLSGGSAESSPGDAPWRFEQATLEAEVVGTDGLPLDFRSVIELYERARVGIDPGDPRARLTESGSLLSARRGVAVLRSPPIRTGRGDGQLIDEWARREVTLLDRHLPIEGRVQTLGPPRLEELAPASDDTTSGRDGPARPPTVVGGTGVEGSSAGEGPALLPYEALAAGWAGTGWQAGVVVVAPLVVVIGLVDGTSTYSAVPLTAVPDVVALLDQADLAGLRSLATPVTILSRHWRLNSPTRSTRLGPRRGFLRHLSQ
ncbi:MAG: hypothetical protein AAF531_14680 [Actinomycetota bacterium]